MAHHKKKPSRSASSCVAQLANTLASLQAPLLGPNEILSSAYVSDNIPGHVLEQMSEDDARMVEAGRSAGSHLVHVYWRTGQSALMFCPPGCNMPAPHMVVQAYERTAPQSLGKPNGARRQS